MTQSMKTQLPAQLRGGSLLGPDQDIIVGYSYPTCFEALERASISRALCHVSFGAGQQQRVL